MTNKEAHDIIARICAKNNCILVSLNPAVLGHKVTVEISRVGAVDGPALTELIHEAMPFPYYPSVRYIG